LHRRDACATNAYSEQEVVTFPLPPSPQPSPPAGVFGPGRRVTNVRGHRLHIFGLMGLTKSAHFSFQPDAFRGAGAAGGSRPGVSTGGNAGATAPCPLSPNPLYYIKKIEVLLLDIPKTYEGLGGELEGRAGGLWPPGFHLKGLSQQSQFNVSRTDVSIFVH